MRTDIEDPVHLPLLVTGLGLLLAGQVTAQTFTNLYSFSATPYPYTNSDGAYPQAALTASGATFYGTTSGGGSFEGTLFTVKTNGTGFTNLHTFSALPGFGGTNSDGATPVAALALSGDTLYGTEYAGGHSGNGTVFKISTNGTGFMILHTFTATSGTGLTNGDGAHPRAGLILSGSTLYGTAAYGGSSGFGTLFKVDTDGTNFTILRSFTNSDGALPYGSLFLSGDTLYGTTAGGGRFLQGTVLAVNTNGTGFTNLYSFSATSGPAPATNSDGASPHAGLILSGNMLYGTTSRGGKSGNGIVFGVKINGTSFTNLHSFTAGSGSVYTNSDGVNPPAGLVLSESTLYGTTFSGGNSGNGTVFGVSTDGTTFATVHNFSPTAGFDDVNNDGANPSSGLVLSGKTLAGTAQNGGTQGNGALFSLGLGPVSEPRLTIKPLGSNVILTWPTDATGFSLQCSPTVMGTYTNIVNATSPFTNPATTRQQFFRLAE